MLDVDRSLPLSKKLGTVSLSRFGNRAQLRLPWKVSLLLRVLGPDNREHLGSVSQETHRDLPLPRLLDVKMGW